MYIVAYTDGTYMAHTVKNAGMKFESHKYTEFYHPLAILHP